MTQVHDIYNTINLHSLTYRKLFMQSRLSSLSKQKGMIKDDFNVTWYEVSATNTGLFDRSIVPVCPFNSLQSQMSSIFFKRMRSCRNPEKLDSRTGAIFTVHDATSIFSWREILWLTHNSMGWNELSDPDMRTANFELSCDVYREGVYWHPLYFCPYNESQWEQKLLDCQHSSKYLLLCSIE